MGSLLLPRGGARARCVWPRDRRAQHAVHPASDESPGLATLAQRLPGDIRKTPHSAGATSGGIPPRRARHPTGRGPKPDSREVLNRGGNSARPFGGHRRWHRPARAPRLPVYRRDVAFDRLDAHKESVRDLPVRAATREQAQHLYIPDGEFPTWDDGRRFPTARRAASASARASAGFAPSGRSISSAPQPAAYMLRLSFPPRGASGARATAVSALARMGQRTHPRGERGVEMVCRLSYRAALVSSSPRRRWAASCASGWRGSVACVRAVVACSYDSVGSPAAR